MLLSISEGVTRLARVGRMTCKVRCDFKIITNELSRVSRQFHWWHRTFGDLWFVPQNLYKKQVRRFWRVESSFQNRRIKTSRGPDPCYPVCYDRRMSTASSHPHRSRLQEEGRRNDVTKMNFSSCNDHSPKWIINNCDIFFPYLRVWVFLFLRTSFFTAQHVSPMLQCQHWRT